MTSILSSDLKFLAAARMDDSDDSGGYPSYTELLDNDDNNLFPDVASGDRIAGRTHLRKCFAAVRNLDDEPLLAARAYLSLPPNDSAVSVCLLDSGGHASETRETALEAIYTAAQQSTNTGLRLFQNCYQGETVLPVYWITNQTPALYRLPTVDEIIFIEDDTGGVEQYVRVVAIATATGTASITITPPLNANFRGRWDDSVDYVTNTQIYLTRAIPLGHGIYGITPLSATASSGDVTALIESSEAAIAPTVYEEIANSLQGSTQRKTLAVTAVDSLLQTATLDPMPTLADISVSYRDKYNVLRDISGSTSPERFSVVGTSITVTLTESPTIKSSQSRIVTASPTKTISAQTFYTGKDLYPGSVTVEARTADGDAVGGTDDGLGAMTGYGGLTGTVDYDDGIIDLAFSEAVYLNGLKLNYGYTSAQTYRQQAAVTTQTTLLYIPLNYPVDEGSITLTANRFDTGAQITGTDSGGVISGSGITSGTIIYSTGWLTVTFSTAVYAASIRVDYTYQASMTWTLTAGHYPVSSYSADTGSALTAGQVTVTATDYETGVVYSATDDGLGAFDNDGITGTVNYATGEVALTFASDVLYSSIIVAAQTATAYSPIYWQYADAADETDFVLALKANIVPSSITLTALTTDDSSTLTATDDGTGGLTGDATGTVDYTTGALAASFSEEVAVASLYVTYRNYAASTVNSLIGGTLNVVRLPASKSYPMVKAGDMAVFHHPVATTLPNPAVANTTYTLDRDTVTRIWVEDAEGTQIPDTKYSANLALGSITMASDLDLTGYNQPLVAWTVIADEVLITGLENRNQVRFTPALTHDFPATASYLSTCFPVGDLGASITAPFSQSAWTSVWQDTLIGSPIAAQYDYTSYPIVVTNDGAITERWRLTFASSTTLHITGEHVGQITLSALSTTAEIAPLNPSTGKPYFTINLLGWGAGWVAGNLLRFNTTGADCGIWAIRCVQPSTPPDPGTPDRVRLTLLGDVDA